MIKVDNAILDTIIEAKKNNKLAFFIGAGFSKNSETEFKRIPLWSDLINDLKKSLNIENENDFLKIAQLYYLKYGEYQYYNKLKKYFELNLEPSTVHKKLFSLIPNLIVTTNWDCLLEKTAIEEGLTYDVVTNDSDLVKSSYFHKILKMHGDFSHHNIVFKEDDYLNYSENFPLIENYIKSILSTHVVIFIGYSYSDIDLKLITKWIETKSKVTPPKFLFSRRYNEAEASYLKNHGIQLLKPEFDENYSTSDVLKYFFDIISEKNEFLRYKILIEKDQLLASEELLLIKFLYEKIKILDELESIFPKQIKELLSNSSLEHHNGCYGLYLISDSILTTDYDSLVRKYYTIIMSVMKKNKELDNETSLFIRKIFNIFKKANIILLKFRSDNNKSGYINIYEYLGEPIERSEPKYFDFLTKGEANDMIFIENYKDLSKKSSQKISANIKDKSYISLAINSFNNEVAERRLKLDLKEDEKNDEKKSKEDSKVFKDYFDFYGLSDKKEYNFINNFLNFNVLDNVYFLVSERIKKNIGILENIISGGLSFDSSQTEEELLIESYLNFMYKNDIAMENFTNVISLFSNHIEYKIKCIELKYQEKKDEKVFNFQSSAYDVRLRKIDLFILLNFTDKKIITKLLKVMVGILDRDTNIKIEDFFNNENSLRSYLTCCYDNLLSNKYTAKNVKILSNLIIFSSLCDWDDGGFLISKLNSIFIEYQEYSTIEAINSFVAFNSNFFKSKSMDFSPYIDFIINLILSNKINGFAFGAIENGSLSNIFNYMSWRKDYSNLDLINKFIYFLESPNLNNKDFYLLNILMYLLYISNPEVREHIRSYIFKLINVDNVDEKFEIFLLSLIYDDNFLDSIMPELAEKYLNKFKEYCIQSFVFKEYLLKNIVIELAKNDTENYEFFREIKKEFNL